MHSRIPHAKINMEKKVAAKLLNSTPKTTTPKITNQRHPIFGKPFDIEGVPTYVVTPQDYLGWLLPAGSLKLPGLAHSAPVMNAVNKIMAHHKRMAKEKSGTITKALRGFFIKNIEEAFYGIKHTTKKPRTKTAVPDNEFEIKRGMKEFADAMTDPKFDLKSGKYGTVYSYRRKRGIEAHLDKFIRPTGKSVIIPIPSYKQPKE